MRVDNLLPAISTSCSFRRRLTTASVIIQRRLDYPRRGVAECFGMGWRNGSEQGGGINRNEVAGSLGIRRSPQVKSSKAQIQAKYHKIPTIHFEDQRLTSFSGLLIFQILFRRLNLKQRLYKCFSNGKVSPIFGRHLVVLLLIVHLILGFRRLREVDYYRDDPLVLRLLGLNRLPDVSTISRALSDMKSKEVEKIQEVISNHLKKCFNAEIREG